MSRFSDEDLEACMCDCADCKVHPQSLILFRGEGLGFDVAIECPECHQRSEGGHVPRCHPEDRLQEVLRWNAKQERLIIEQGNHQPAPSPRRRRM